MDEQLKKLIEGAKKQGASDNDVKKIIDLYIADQKKKESSEPTSQKKPSASPTRTTQPSTSSATEPPTRAAASVALGGPTKLFGQQEQQRPQSVMYGDGIKQENVLIPSQPIDAKQKKYYRVVADERKSVQDAIRAIEDKNLKLGRSIDEIQSEGTYQYLQKKKQQLDEEFKPAEVAIREVKKDAAFGTGIVERLISSATEGKQSYISTETIRLDKEVEDKLIDLYDDSPEEIKQKWYKGALPLEKKEELINAAKTEVLNSNYKKLKEENKYFLTDIKDNPTISKEDKIIAYNALKAKNEAFDAKVASEFSGNLLKDNFKSTTKSKDLDEAIMGRFKGFLPEQADAVSTFLEGMGQVIAKTEVAIPEMILMGGERFNQAVGTSDAENYTPIDATLDLINDTTNLNFLPSSKIEKGQLITQGGDFNINLYSVEKSLANTLPFTLKIINDVKKGRIEGAPQSMISQLVNPKYNKGFADKLRVTETAYKATIGDNYRDAKDMGMDDSKAFTYANVMSLAEGISENIMPDFKYFDSLTGTTLKSAFKGSLKSAATKQAVKNVTKDFFKNVASELGEEEFVLAVEDGLKYSLLLNHKNSEFFNLKRQKELMAATVIMSGAIGGVAIPSKYKQNKTDIYREVYNNIGNLQDSFNEEINSPLNDEKTKQTFRDAYAFASEVSNAIAKAPENVTSDQVDLLIQKNKLEEKKKTIDSAFHPDINEEIAGIDEKIREFNKQQPTTEIATETITEAKPAETVDSLKDVESTANALNEDLVSSIEETANMLFPKSDKTNNIVAEAYHQAKQDGSNPELVKAVEDLLGMPTAEQVIESEATPAEVISETTVEVTPTTVTYNGTEYSKNDAGNWVNNKTDNEVKGIGPKGKALISALNNMAETETITQPQPTVAEQAPKTEIEEALDDIVRPKTTNIKDQVDRAKKALSKIMKGVEIILHDTEESYSKVTKDRTSGAYINGVIHLNPAEARRTTVAHEVFHAVLLKYVADGKPATILTNKMLKAVARSLKDKPEVMATINEFVKNGYQGQKEIWSEEKLAEVLGYLASEYETLPQPTKNIIQKWLEKIAIMLKMKPFTDKEVVDFMNTLAERVREGQEITEADVSDVLGKEKVTDSNAENRKQAVSLMKGTENLVKYGLKQGKNITRKVGEALEKRQRQKYGYIEQNDRSESAKNKISNWMVDEVKYFIETMGDKSGKGWYGEKYQKALDNMSKIFPEMKSDKNARDLFTILVAITSDGQKVLSNFKLASFAYDYYKKNGTMPSTLPGQRTASFEANLKRINKLLSDYKGDIASIKKDLMEIKSIEELNKERKKEGLDPLNTSWPVSFKAPFAASVFGPKLGMFYSNLSGNEAYPTLDRWWSRTFNRYRGTLIPSVKGGFNKKGEALGLDRFKQLLGSPNMSNEEAILASKTYRDSYAKKGYKNGTEAEKAANTIYKIAYENLNDAPFNKTDRQFMYESVSKALSKLNKEGYNLSIADVQAILWYFEKNLYKTLGVQANIEGISYEEAANTTFEKWKSNNNSFDYNIKESEDDAGVEGADEDIKEEENEATGRHQISPENSSNYANMTEDGKGNFVFFHFGPRAIKFIDPKKYGSNKGAITSKPEVAAMGRVGGMSQFYTMPEYQESNVSGDKYMIKVPMDKVYDFNTDPDNLIGKAKEMFKSKYPDLPFTANDQVAFITKLAEKAGYDMTVAEWNGMSRAQSTKPLKPVDTQVMDGNTITKPFNENYESNATKGFTAVVPVSKEAKLKEVYDNINNERNSQNRYDGLYRLREEASKKTQEEITKMIEESDISQEMKDAYAEAVAYEPAGRSSSRRQVNVKAIAENTKTEVDRIKGLPIKSVDGATFNMDGTKYEGGGLVVPMGSLEGNTTQEKLSPEMIGEFAKDNQGKIGDDEIVKLGLYKFEDENTVSVDLNIVIPNKYREVALEFGALIGQESLYDLDSNENVKTGADGMNPVDLTDEQFRAAAASLKDGKMPQINVSRRQQPSALDRAVATAKSRGFDDKTIMNYLVSRGYTSAEATKAVLKYNKAVAEKARQEEGVFTRAGRRRISIALDKFRRITVSKRAFNTKTGLQLREFMEGNISAELREARLALEEYDKMLSKYRGDKAALEAEADKFLKGDSTANIPLEFKAVIGKFRTHIDNLTMRLIDTGTLTQAQADKFRSNIGEYVNRSYKVFDDPKWRDSVTEQMKEAVRNELRNIYQSTKGNVPKSKKDRQTYADKFTYRVEKAIGKSDFDEDVILNKMIEDEINNMLEPNKAGDFVGQKNIASKDLSITKKKNLDIPLSVRQLMGEYGNAGQNYAKTVQKLSALVYKADFLNKMRDLGLGVFFFEKDDPNRDRNEFNTRIAGDTSTTMSPLNGLYTTPELAEMFKEDSTGDVRLLEKYLGKGIGTGIMNAYKVYLKTLGTIKKMKTAYSVGGHSKNVLGNVELVLSNAYIDPKEYANAFMTLKNSKSGEFKKKMDEYIRLGILSSGIDIAEIRKIFNTDSFDSFLESRIKKGYANTVSKFDQKVSNLYQSEDDFFKILGYEIEMKRYEKAYPNESKEEIQAMVSNNIKNILPNYNRIGKIGDLARALPLASTFMSYQLESYRTAWNNIALAKQEMSSDNKVLRDIGRKRIVGALATQTVKHFIMHSLGTVIFSPILSLLASGDDDEEELTDYDKKVKYMKLMLPEYAKGDNVVITKEGDGKVSFINFSSSDPRKGISNSISATMQGKDPINGLVEGMKSIADPFLNEDILLQFVKNVKNNEKQSGDKIYEESASDFDKGVAITDEAFKVLQPGTYTSANKIYKSEDARNEALGQLTGYKTHEIDVKKNLYFRLRDLKKMEESAQNSYRDANYKFEEGKIDKVERDRLQAQAKKSADKTYNEMRDYLKAASYFGAKDYEIDEAFEKNRISDYVIKTLWSNEMPVID